MMPSKVIVTMPPYDFVLLLLKYVSTRHLVKLMGTGVWCLQEPAIHLFKARKPEIRSQRALDALQEFFDDGLAVYRFVPLRYDGISKLVYASNNSMQRNDILSIKEALESDQMVLKVLELWGVCRDDRLPYNGILCLAGALGSNTTLTTLNLTNCHIYDSGAVALAGVLEINTTLTRLSICDDTIETNGVMALGRALEKNSTLKTLKLTNTSSISRGFIQIATALRRNSTLTALDLAHNTSLGNMVAKALATALRRHNSTLVKLDVWDTPVKSKGIQALAIALKHNSTLLKLNIDGSLLESDDIPVLLDALKSNTTLTTLYMGFEWFDPDGAFANEPRVKQY